MNHYTNTYGQQLLDCLFGGDVEAFRKAQLDLWAEQHELHLSEMAHEWEGYEDELAERWMSIRQREEEYAAIDDYLRRQQAGEGRPATAR